MPEATIHIGDCIGSMRTMPVEFVHSCVTDPPYGLSFMGKKWDYDVPSVETWKEVLRVLKPGGHLLAFGGSRTFHRMAVNIEDAGFEMRDTVMWLYGSGFPKSLDVSKAIDKEAGADRPVIGSRQADDIRGGNLMHRSSGESQGNHKIDITAPATDAAKEWDGWGTALKPAHEPIILARKPFPSTVAENAQEHGTGALNIDACRIEAMDGVPKFSHRREASANTYGDGKNGSNRTGEVDASTGRWPANVVHDGSEEAVAPFAGTEGLSRPGDRHVGHDDYAPAECKNTYYGGWTGYKRSRVERHYDDEGSAARFFYCAKASPSERGEYNDHPTVKPLALMQWLVRLVTPRDGIVLDPYMGSGSTAIAALGQGFTFIGCELQERYAEIAERRITEAAPLFNQVNIAA